MLNLTNFLVTTKLESSFAVATILDDSNSDGGAISEVIDGVSNVIFPLHSSIFLNLLYI